MSLLLKQTKKTYIFKSCGKQSEIKRGTSEGGQKHDKNKKRVPLPLRRGEGGNWAVLLHCCFTESKNISQQFKDINMVARVTIP